jgi:hypothetical protein
MSCNRERPHDDSLQRNTLQQYILMHQSVDKVWRSLIAIAINGTLRPEYKENTKWNLSAIIGYAPLPWPLSGTEAAAAAC